MKKICFSLLCLLTLSFQNSFSQCCPYLDNAELTPAHPTQLDSIFLITRVTTPNQGKYLGYEIDETDSLITVTACYYNGLLTALQTYHDTINLGTHVPGTLKVSFIAWTSSNDTICNFVDNQSTQVQTEVTFTNSIFNPVKPSISIFPNPIIDHRLTVEASENIQEIRMYNKLGQLVLSRKTENEKRVDVTTAYFPKGIYYLVATLVSGIQVSKKLVKY